MSELWTLVPAQNEAVRVTEPPDRKARKQEAT